MAVVWSAVHTETDRKVALKLVRAEFVQDEKVRELFVQEARVAARIGRSEHIVDVLDAGVDAALGVPFIAMDLLNGNTLETRLKAGALPRAMAADLLEQLAEALEQAHAAGVVHRDLKPANLFLTADRKGAPNLKVLDFGIAKLADSKHKAATHVGTPAYSAPEQLGDAWRAIAAREGKVIAEQISTATDVWAVGLIAFEMLTGAAPGVFWGATTLAELPVKMVMEPLPTAVSRADAARIPPGFDAWIARCLDIDARRRWPSARAAVDALVPALRGSIPPMPAASPAAPFPVAVPAAPNPIAFAVTPPPMNPANATVAAAPLPTYPQYPQHHYQQAYPVYQQHGDPRLAAWAKHHQAEIRGPADPRSFAWPVTFMPRVAHVPREARVPLANGHFVLAEAVTSDPLRQAVGEDRLLLVVMQSPQFRYRAAVRSQRSSGVVDGVAQGLKGLGALISQTGGPLKDPQFEAQYEVWGRTPQEAHAAIPVSLRQLFFGLRFHGIFEQFPGAIMLTLFDAPRFEPGSLDRVMDVTKRIAALF